MQTSNLSMKFLNTPWRRLGAAALACVALAASAAEPVVLATPRIAPFDSLDPPRAFDANSDPIVHDVYSNLLTYSYLERPYKLAPDLVEALPTLSPDRLTLTFKLRHGVRLSLIHI